MAEASILQSVGGILGSQRWEFRRRDVVVGSGPDCAVRIEAPGVEVRHARIVIDAPGATIYRLDGVVGVNDDLVTTAGLLHSGDFVWLGEPGGASSIMLQFTIGEGDEAAVASPPRSGPMETPGETVLEGVGPADLVPLGADPEGVPPAESPQPLEPGEFQAVSSESPVMEAPPVASDVEEAQPEPERSVLEPLPVTPSSFEPVALEVTTAEIPKEPPARLEPLPEVEPALPEVEPALAEVEPEPTLLPPPIVPLAPWQMPSVSVAEPAAPAEYASAWESAPAAPVAAEDPDATVLLPKATAPVSSAAPAFSAPTRQVLPPPPSASKRPFPAAPRMTPRTVEQDAALRTPPPSPPARTTASTPLVVGGLATLLVVGGVGLFLLRPASTPTAPPRQAPTAAVIDTPPAATPEPTQMPAFEPTLAPPPPVSTPVAPKPSATATPLPRVTPSPRIAPTPRVTPTPLPAPTARPAAPTATVGPPVAAPAPPASQVPRLIEEAQAAVIARDFPRASQILDEALRLDPGNAAAAARKTEVEIRRTSLARKFSYGATSVIGGKAAKGPTGFDLGGGGAVKTDLAAQIRCTTTPTSVEVGMRHSERCSIVNIGTKAFRIESVVVNEVLDGAKSAGAGVAPRTDIAPQSDAVIAERIGVWNARTQWSIELVVKTTKGESFRAAYSWR